MNGKMWLKSRKIGFQNQFRILDFGQTKLMIIPYKNEMGFSDEIVRRASGHKNLEAYQQYVKLDPSVVMRLVGTMDKKADNFGIKTTESLDG